MYIEDNVWEIVTIRLDVEPEAIRESLALLSDGERQRANRFAFDRDRRRYAVARARLRQLLSERLNIQPESVELVYGAHGKPALAPAHAAAGLRFNVSHCQDVAVVAFARGREIGIDVEAVRSIPDADDIAARFFSRRENETYRALDARDKPLGFFNCWTRKEAFIKALGDGLSHPLGRFDVSLTPGESARFLSIDGVRGEDCGWAMYDFTPYPGFAGAAVAEERSGSARTAARHSRYDSAR